MSTGKRMPNSVERTSPRALSLRDLTDKKVRDQIVSKAHRDANSTLIRKLRVADRRSALDITTPR